MTSDDQDGNTGACWLHPHVQVRVSAIQGSGLFAAQPLPARTTVATLAGGLVSEEQLHRLLRTTAASGQYLDSICIDDDTHLVLAPGQPIHYGNHSCDPNLWHTDAYTLAARRDVSAGEELTVDYATQTVAAGFLMPCRCGAPACRKAITGNDWQIPHWRERYQGHVVPAVARRIAAALGGEQPLRGAGPLGQGLTPACRGLSPASVMGPLFEVCYHEHGQNPQTGPGAGRPC